jgi:hypothetical protein
MTGNTHGHSAQQVTAQRRQNKDALVTGKQKPIGLRELKIDVAAMSPFLGTVFQTRDFDHEGS